MDLYEKIFDILTRWILTDSKEVDKPDRFLNQIDILIGNLKEDIYQ